MGMFALAETTPIAVWPLSENANDASGNNRHAVNHNVSFEHPAPNGVKAAYFNGKNAFLEVPSEQAPALGNHPFTLSTQVYTDEILDDALGDVAGKFDPDSRKGFTFGLATYSGVANSQPNYRNVFFGVDNGRLDAQWTDCGRPGNAIFIFGMAVFAGNLYAATCEPQQGEAGHVYRYDGGQNWADCGSPDGSNAVAALAVFKGSLYAGTAWYDTTGSALGASPNTTPGGKVYRYAGGANWIPCGALSNPETGEAATMGGLGVFRGALYATTLKQPGFGLYRYIDGTKWEYCGNPGRRVLNPFVFNGNLYMVSYDAPGGPFCFDGNAWSYSGASISPGIDQDYSFAAYGGSLFLSTWPKAHVYRMEADGAWSLHGRPGEELETMGMMVYNGKLYTGTLPSATVYRYDANDCWTPIGQPLDTSDNKYRRAWSMALFQGKLFCGTLPSGKVFSIEAGKNVTSDHELEPGWHHLTAVRQENALRLYIDGRRIAENAFNQNDAYDIANKRPLSIGFGPGDYFHGWMRDFRIYESALSEEVIHALH